MCQWDDHDLYLWGLYLVKFKTSFFFCIYCMYTWMYILYIWIFFKILKLIRQIVWEIWILMIYYIQVYTYTYINLVKRVFFETQFSKSVSDSFFKMAGPIVLQFSHEFLRYIIFIGHNLRARRTMNTYREPLTILKFERKEMLTRVLGFFRLF